MTSDAPSPLLQMEGIEKSFPGVRALRAVGLDLHAGEVHAIVGENGAGKSTLIKVLAGAHQPDRGRIAIAGSETAFSSPLDAQRAGIGVIYQEYNLIPTLTVRENVLLGRELRGGFLSKREERERVGRLFALMHVEIPQEELCSRLSVAQQQLVEIAKALSLGARILVMDEPTAALTSQEVDNLFRIIGELKAQGIGIIYISHRLEEIFAVADRVTVLRDGQYIGTRHVEAVDRSQLIEMMVGRPLEKEFPPRTRSAGPERLVVTDLGRGRVRSVSFRARGGEILALTGLVGAGRTEVARLLFGADRAETGFVELDGRRLRLNSPRDAIGEGICLLTEDRKQQGLVLALSSRENFALPNLGSWSRLGFINRANERSAFARKVDALRIKLSHLDQPATTLSGGNQQKVLLARWLESNSEVVIFDEPTRGIDVGAKYEIYVLMDQLAASGKVVIMISSELPEVLGMSDRILVMHQGRISGEITDVTGASQEDVMHLAMGGNSGSVVGGLAERAHRGPGGTRQRGEADSFRTQAP